MEDITVIKKFYRKDWAKRAWYDQMIEVPITIKFPVTNTLQIRTREHGDKFSLHYCGVDVNNKKMCSSCTYRIFGHNFLDLIEHLIKYDTSGQLDIEKLAEIYISDYSDFICFDDEQNYDSEKHRELCLDEETLERMLNGLCAGHTFDEAIKKQMDYKFNAKKEPTYESYIERAKKMFITAITTIYNIRQNVYGEEIAAGFEKGETFYAKGESRKENENYDFHFYLSKEIDNLDLSDLPCIDTKEKWSLICRNELWKSENFYIKDEKTQELFSCVYNFFYY